jgi:anti-sigma factor RsiW
MTPTTDHPRRHFDELVPFYLTGQLSVEQSAWAEQYIASHPEARAELEWHRDLMREVVSQAEARAEQAPPMVGWAGVQVGLRGLRRAATPSLWDRFGAWLGPLTARPLAPIAALVIVVQAGVIGALMQRPAVVEDEPTRSAASVPARDVLQVRFKQSTAERELRGLLYSVGARIVDGPDQLGDYLIEPRSSSLATLQSELERSESVQSVRVLKAWKPEPRQE